MTTYTYTLENGTTKTYESKKVNNYAFGIVVLDKETGKWGLWSTHKDIKGVNNESSKLERLYKKQYQVVTLTKI
jgi:hypothetical protein